MNRIINKDCLEGMKELPANSVDCCVTSPPYFGLRDYGHEGQIGLEETPEQYVDKMVEVFEQVKWVLKPEGTLWLNLGDSYCASSTGSQGNNSSKLEGGKSTQIEAGKRPDKSRIAGVKQKDLIGIPWLVAFALRSAGWYLRQDIIWHKPNPMPESVTDRCTKAHEYIFLLSKSAKYYYDHEAIKLPLAKASHLRLAQDIANQKGSDRVPGKTNGAMKAVGSPIKKVYKDKDGMTVGELDSEVMKQLQLMTLEESIEYLRKNIKDPTFGGKKGREYTPERDDPNFRNGSEQWGREWLPSEDGYANKRSVWTVTTKPFSEAHFATFPEDLIVDCIKAGCPEYVCSKCGKAREKIFESTGDNKANEVISHNGVPGLKKDSSHDRVRSLSGATYEHVRKLTDQLTDCGCNEGFSPGVCLDPFMGAGTTALVARKLNRNYIGFELNQEYIKIAEKRLRDELGMFL
jgi:DNA modification methylase